MKTSMVNARDDYEEHGNDPMWWIFKAEEMLIAADILEKEHSRAENEMKQGSGYVPKGGRLLSVIIFLKAETVELLLKALYLAKGEKIIEDDKFVLTKDHSLTSLAEKVGFPLNDRETILSEKLTEAIYSWGRYPIPTHKKNWRKKTKEGEGFIYIWSEKDSVLTEDIINRLYLALDINSNGSTQSQV